MAVSLLNVLIADKVEALLDDPHVRDNLKDDERGFTKVQASAIIHAALWAYSARAGSTAEAYARINLFDAIGLKSWSFKEPAESGPAVICPNCDSALPEGCGGTFKESDDTSCWLNRVQCSRCEKHLQYTVDPSGWINIEAHECPRMETEEGQRIPCKECNDVVWCSRMAGRCKITSLAAGEQKS